MSINDFITLQGSVSDIVDSDNSCVAARHTYQSVNSWAPWMKMGDREGFLLGRGNGRKLSSLEELPTDIHEAILEHEPDMLKFVDAAPWQEVLSPSNQ